MPVSVGIDSIIPYWPPTQLLITLATLTLVTATHLIALQCI
jgi:hypothetical protein